MQGISEELEINTHTTRYKVGKPTRTYCTAQGTKVNTGEDPDAGRDRGQEEKGTTQDEMAGGHHGLDGRESE